MSRSRKVEPEAAVNAAVAMFWKHGYCNLGTRQLEEETGITRFTLQTTYGGKMSLFLVALDAYLDAFEGSRMAAAAAEDIEGIASFFEIRAQGADMQEMSCLGCLMLNSMIEFSAQNPEVNRRAERYASLLRGCFTTALKTALKRGALGPEVDIDARVDVLFAATLGLNAVMRSTQGSIVVNELAKSIAGLVRGWDKSDGVAPRGAHS
jgi:TetR/AcrR family transcriptional repressor of nem operon